MPAHRRPELPRVPATRVLRWVRWQGLADTFTLLDEFVASLEVAKKASAAAELRALVEEQRQCLLAAKDDVAAWLPALDLVAGDGWTRLETLVMRLLEENAGVLDAASLHGLRIATRHINNDIFVLQRTVRLLLPWLPMLSEPPHLFVAPAADLPASSRASSTLPLAYQVLLALLPSNALLIDLPSTCEAAHGALAELLSEVDRLPAASPALVQEARAWCTLLAERLTAAQTLSQELLDGMAEIDSQAETYFQEMNFHFLYDQQRQLFRIGYNVSAAVADNNFYDLLASEARDRQPRSVGKARGPAQPLAAPGPPTDTDPWYARPALLERHHVRIPDADAADAQLSGHIAA